MSRAGSSGIAAFAPLRASSTRKSLLFEEISRRHSGELGDDAVTSAIAHMVHCDSSTVLAAYYSSGVPAPGELYSLHVGDLYRLEFLRSLPSEGMMAPGRRRHRTDLLAFSEAECAEQLQLWTVAALCRWGGCGTGAGAGVRRGAVLQQEAGGCGWWGGCGNGGKRW
jgi:hypothetical protein